MQTTLLGLATAIILALLAALVGPLFVDWGAYRAEFEATASRLTGLTVRIEGQIEARLLPTPTLTLQKIEIARPGDAGALHARSLGVEFALGPLVRGEWRATDARVEGAEFALGIDAAGRVDWPAPSIGFAPDSISIEHLDVVDSRAILADASTGSHLILENLEFQGEMRSLAGPLKGEGSFVVAGQHYPYRVSASRAGADGAVRVHLNVDPIDRPLIADADATIWVEHGVPRFDGSLQLTRPVGRAPDGIIEPWRVTSRIRGDSAAAVLEQIDFQYGGDEHPVKLRGDANLTFGRRPQLVIGLAATQIDLDHVLALPEPSRRRPLVAVKTFADFFGGGPPWPIPVKLGISVENVTFAGATLQRVSGEVKADADSWDVELLDFRAPGATQVRLSGRLNVSAKGIAFEGPAKVEARDPRALVAWLTDRADVQNITSAALRAEGEVKLDSETIAVERLKAELDRMTLEGRFAYSWPNAERPARIEAALGAPDIDLDRVYALTQALLADTSFEWPREGTLALKAGHASVAGVEAKLADVNVQFDRQGFEIERLAIGDFGGATLAIKGRFDTRAATPRGNLTLDFDARALDGLAAIVEKFSPQSAAELRRRAARLIPAKLTASLVVNADPPRMAGAAARAGAAPAAAFKIAGSAGPFRINLQGDADGLGEGVSIANLAHLAGAKVKLAGRLDASDGGALVELLGLDSLVAVDKRAGRLNLTASGTLDGDLAVVSQVVAGGLDVSANGTVRLAGSEGPTAGLALKVATANVRSPRPPAAGRPAEMLPTALTARLAFAEGVIGLSNLAGKVAGTDVSGRLKIGLAQPASIEGDIEVGTVNLPAVIAASVGLPGPAAVNSSAWATEPFDQGLLDRLSGQVTLKSARVMLSPKLAVTAARAVLRLGESELTLAEIDGAIAGGRVAGELAFRRSPDGVTSRSQLRFASADLAELLPGDGRGPLSGRITFNVDVEGTGRSPVALIGALHGSGTFTLQDGQILRFDPATFAAVIRSVDLGLPVDMTRIRDRVESTLASGRLAIPLAEGEVAIAAGQARLGNATVRAQGADLALIGSIHLAESAIDARVTLSGPEDAAGPPGSRPEITIVLKGPVDAPKRTLEVAALTNWLALRAVEQQTKRIDALESGREVPASTYGSPSSTASVPPAATPGAATPQRPARATPEAPATTAQRRAARRAQRTPPAVEQPPTFAPPLDVRPLPQRAPGGATR